MGYFYTDMLLCSCRKLSMKCAAKSRKPKRRSFRVSDVVMWLERAAHHNVNARLWLKNCDQMLSVFSSHPYLIKWINPCRYARVLAPEQWSDTCSNACRRMTHVCGVFAAQFCVFASLTLFSVFPSELYWFIPARMSWPVTGVWNVKLSKLFKICPNPPCYPVAHLRWSRHVWRSWWFDLKCLCSVLTQRALPKLPKQTWSNCPITQTRTRWMQLCHLLRSPLTSITCCVMNRVSAFVSQPKGQAWTSRLFAWLVYIRLSPCSDPRRNEQVTLDDRRPPPLMYASSHCAARRDSFATAFRSTSADLTNACIISP